VGEGTGGGCFLWSPEDLLNITISYTHIENDIFIENL
jgi:hypothetical protein